MNGRVAEDGEVTGEETQLKCEGSVETNVVKKETEREGMIPVARVTRASIEGDLMMRWRTVEEPGTGASSPCPPSNGFLLLCPEIVLIFMIECAARLVFGSVNYLQHGSNKHKNIHNFNYAEIFCCCCILDLTMFRSVYVSVCVCVCSSSCNPYFGEISSLLK